MANQKLSDLVNLPADQIESDDLMLIVDVSSLASPTGEAKNVKVSQLADYLSGSFNINELDSNGYPLSASKGGTGQTYLTPDTVLVGNGTSSIKMIDGTDGHFLRKNPIDSAIEFVDVSPSVNINQTSGGPLMIPNGGTGRSSLQTHAVLYGAGTNNVGLTNVGSDYTVLAGNNGAPPSFTSLGDLLSPYTGSLGGSGGGTAKEVISGSGAFPIGSILRKTNGGYTLASATDSVNAEVIGIVENNTTDTFTLVYGGKVNFPGSSTIFSTNTTSVIDGVVYFLNTGSGTMHSVPASGIGQVNKPLFIATGLRSGLFHNWRGLINSTASGSAGTGSVDVLQDSVSIVNDISALNFVGATVTDTGGGVATITVTGGDILDPYDIWYYS